jgi:hypothetical protein
VRAIFDFVGESEDELSVVAGEVIINILGIIVITFGWGLAQGINWTLFHFTLLGLGVLVSALRRPSRLASPLLPGVFGCKLTLLLVVFPIRFAVRAIQFLANSDVLCRFDLHRMKSEGMSR